MTKTVSNLQLSVDREDGRLEHMVRESMRQTLASALVDKAVVTTKKAFATEYRMSVLVVTPEEFFRAVERAAMNLERRRPLQF